MRCLPAVPMPMPRKEARPEVKSAEATASKTQEVRGSADQHVGVAQNVSHEGKPQVLVHVSTHSPGQPIVCRFSEPQPCAPKRATRFLEQPYTLHPGKMIATYLLHVPWRVVILVGQGCPGKIVIKYVAPCVAGTDDTATTTSLNALILSNSKIGEVAKGNGVKDVEHAVNTPTPNLIPL